MKIKSISFENYKAFAEKQTLELKPITLLIGKNSSGKSSIAKLFTLLENSLSGNIQEPLLMNNNGVELGAEFRDLVCGRYPHVPINFSIEYEGYFIDKTILSAKIAQDESFELNILEWSFDNFSIKHLKNKEYIDSQGNTYKCDFRGIILYNALSETEVNVTDDIYNGKYHDAYNQTIDVHLKIDIDYIGPFRILPQRQFHLTGQLNHPDTGIKGENAYSMLGVSKLMKTDLHEKVGEWYKTHFDGWELKVNDKNKPYIEILLSKNDTDVNIVDVGQGMNQVLPLVVRAFEKNRSNSIIVLEQPELHLHPAAHGDIAELFAKSAKENNQTFLIETHSENIILRLRSLIVENTFGFTKDDIIIYWVDDAEGGGQEINKITINEEGVLSDWPEGVFTENLNEIKEMRKALNNKKNSKL